MLSFCAGAQNEEVVSIGHDATLAAGERADQVVAVLGSAASAGEVSGSVVSVLGNTHVTGPVDEEVVAVMGNVYINSRVGGDAVAVLGSMELGPQAQIDGKVAVVGGTLKRDPAAVVHGGVQKVMTGRYYGFAGLKPWVKHCLLYGRPLAIAPGLGWAWTLAIVSLLSYVLLALLFRSPVDRCVQTLETRPGLSIVASILTLLFTPVLFALLFITIIGIFLTPFLLAALFGAGAFGKTAILAVLGRRVTKWFGAGSMAHTAVAVLIGGVIILALYVVPVIGFITYNLTGLLGLGVAVYTLVLSIQSARKGVPPT